MDIETREEILRQATELRRKQDALADAPLRGSTVILGGFLTIATIVNTLLVAPASKPTPPRSRRASASP